jgi:prepilin-type processing-associated H-X9-DG protein
VTEGQAVAKPRSKRMVGFYVGTGAALALLVGGLLAVYVRHARKMQEARRIACNDRVHEIALRCAEYARDHDDNWPPDFKVLVPIYVDWPSVFWCPGVPRKSVTYADFGPGGKLRESSTSYAYEPGMLAGMPDDLIVVYDKSLANHDGRGRNVGFFDAHAEWWPVSREAEFQEKLQAQREAVTKWREAGAKKEDIGKFFGKLAEEKSE